MYENGGKDEDAMSAFRRKITGRSVVFIINVFELFICYWGVVKEEFGEWVLVLKFVYFVGMEVVLYMSCEMLFEEFIGCFSADRVSSISFMDDVDLFDECVYM